MNIRLNRHTSAFVACVALICWGFKGFVWKPSNADLHKFGEPGQIADRLDSAEALQPLPQSAQRLVDFNVRPASANLVTLLPLAEQALGAGEDAAFAITKIQQGDFEWTNDDSNVVSLLASNGPVKLIIPGLAAGTKVKVSNQTGQLPEPDKVIVTENVVQIPFNGIQPTTRQNLVVELLKPNGDPTGKLSTVSLRFPSSALSAPQQPTVTDVSNNKFVDPSTKQLKSKVYDQFLRLRGAHVRKNTNLVFHVFRSKTGSLFEFFGTAEGIDGSGSMQDNGVWNADLMLPDGLEVSTDYKLVVLAMTSSGEEQYSAMQSPLEFTVVDPRPLLEKTILSIQDPLNNATKNSPTFDVAGPAISSAGLDDSRAVIFAEGISTPIGFSTMAPSNKWTAKVTVPSDGTFSLRAALVFGNSVATKWESIKVQVGTRGPRVVGVEPSNLSFSPDRKTIKVQFDPDIPVKKSQFEITQGGVAPAAGSPPPGAARFLLKGNVSTAPAISTIEFNELENQVTIKFANEIPPDIYTFTVKKEVEDIFSNHMKKDDSRQLVMPVGGELPTVAPGISGTTGPYVPYGEYTKPRPFINGFNPSDHVETRVSRLYYYRDAHRVAQIVNRDARSYNRAAVDMQQQLADKARTIADQSTDDRRAKEREAVRTAQQTRAAERELKTAEVNAERASAEALNANADLQRKDALLNNPPPGLTLKPEEKNQLASDIKQLPDVINSLEGVARAERENARVANEKVQQLRAKEAEATEKWQNSLAVEDRAREDQFRREVAAANTDPDTYAPGKPGSEDPVRQVSVSVIGEGLIQLRGPIKGINVIRTMINQIDSPVGQVRVAVHTVQINGEKGDRMEVVANKIQRYIDHSRFLTLQSAEMLRKAIVHVAAQKAAEMGGMPGMTQEERDRKYLDAFFGADFIHELEAMDSEFLMTGNKLLSLHSMDTTSLASAMFIMALAKNSTRGQILQTFEGMMASELPMAEQNYFEAGLTCDGKHQLFDKHCTRDDFQLLSQNARFQSIRGLFDVEIAEDDTMTPIQREFVRLAQIFKSQLIVEMELKQRIMERSVIEERLGDRQAELLAARKKEDDANKKLVKAQESLVHGQKAALIAAQILRAGLQSVEGQAMKASDDAEESAKLIQQLIAESLKDLRQLGKEIAAKINDSSKRTEFEKFVSEELAKLSAGNINENEKFASRLRLSRERVANKAMELDQNQTLKLFVTAAKSQPMKLRGRWLDKDFELTIDTNNKATVPPDFATYLQKIIANAESLSTQLSKFSYAELPAKDKELKDADKILRSINQGEQQDETLNRIYDAKEMLQLYNSVATNVIENLGAMIRDMDQIASGIRGDASQLDAEYQRWLRVERRIADRTLLGDTSEAFRKMLEANVDYDFANRQAEAARRPLDHKKFLDMLVDEMEDKNIELLEGVRAHTANIDAYIKRLMTSLDDDFNTQFYYPTFRKVREASQMYDVQLGQVETTTVLANNRSFAKVSPQATMEFDLPKRDILINEAMNSAKAMVNDFGALAQDPTFLAMAQLKSGQPTSSPVAGATGGQSTVRNVLPGLSTDTAESVLSQQGPGGAKFGAAMEALIPDPAIYKFETGTGWEIRPVIQPDGQALVFHFNYMYTTNIREPVRADEKHLGRVKRHFVDTDVQLSNFELREISRYTVALKASRTSRGVPLLEDLPLIGGLWRPLPSDESSLQQNIIMGQSTIFPTLFDLMGLRWAPVVADLDPLRLSNDEFVVRNRRRALMNRVFDQSSSQVDGFLRIPEGERRMDLYRSQETIPGQHPNGYQGPGANLRDSQLQEGYAPAQRPESQFIPGASREGSPYLQRRRENPLELDSPESPAMQPSERAVPDVDVLEEDANVGRPLGTSSRHVPTPAKSGVAPASYSPELEPRQLRVEPSRYEIPMPSEPRNLPRPRLQRLPQTERSAPRAPLR